MADGAKWCLIESDPGLFTELIAKMGAKDTQVEEIYSLDEDSLKALNPVYGLVFLFKWVDENTSKAQGTQPQGTPATDEETQGIFFAHQVVQNACATQAILSIILNKPEIELNDQLKHFKEFTLELTPDLRGHAIDNSDTIRQAHNSFSPQDDFLNDDKPPPTKDGDAFHFISYVRIDGKLYELDGLKQRPISHGECTEDNWLAKAAEVIQNRMASYAQTEIRFNLMTIIKDRRKLYSEQASDIDAKIKDLESTPNSDNSQSSIASLKYQKEDLNQKIEQEETKFARYERDNILRKQNYIPLIYNLIRDLAANSDMDKIINESRSGKFDYQ
ncbi:hypothetical protein H4219_000176 [Mycoemilia scoparia]|uniref:Ubiquitin carboxyl-terminal hydrolase n=1 Tax=Mycoemilia scoparia TaxID=417184 RepID=A0A9W8DS03_9FUNG|nr:hypothetical protein H4219_000176 [Mycoemilia scoparia]